MSVLGGYLLLVLQAAFVTLLWRWGSLFAPIRERGPALWRKLAGCPLCLGFWIGWFGYLVSSAPASASVHEVLATGYQAGLAGAGAGVMALIGHLLLENLDS